MTYRLSKTMDQQTWPAGAAQTLETQTWNQSGAWYAEVLIKMWSNKTIMGASEGEISSWQCNVKKYQGEFRKVSHLSLFHM